MPIYEYQCAACGQVVERWQKISDSPLADCPGCGGSLHKIISSCAFHLKGSGWYVTDYAGKNAASGAGDNGDSAKAAGDSSSGSEAAPADAPKTEAAPASKIK
ncbi:MAG: zinc ribbon domain-containing protein [Desulfobacterales bacterium]|nr:zinc ribbon domain-containing protein [Pseudomonadota bacterium]MBU4357025.1 zinc ribbon domain-containing protein [Pseudomonadota bacterium]MCG2772963.1 zinc ribbon domain-containing protein [Desulfobacterales bacterium]